MPDVNDAKMSEARDAYHTANEAGLDAEERFTDAQVMAGEAIKAHRAAAARVLAEWGEKVRREERERCLKVVGVYDILHHNICESIIEEIRSLP